LWRSAIPHCTAPRDFDISPYFKIVKPTLMEASLQVHDWAEPAGATPSMCKSKGRKSRLQRSHDGASACTCGFKASRCASSLMPMHRPREFESDISKPSLTDRVFWRFQAHRIVPCSSIRQYSICVGELANERLTETIDARCGTSASALVKCSSGVPATTVRALGLSLWQLQRHRPDRASIVHHVESLCRNAWAETRTMLAHCATIKYIEGDHLAEGPLRMAAFREASAIKSHTLRRVPGLQNRSEHLPRMATIGSLHRHGSPRCSRVSFVPLRSVADLSRVGRRPAFARPPRHV